MRRLPQIYKLLKSSMRAKGEKRPKMTFRGALKMGSQNANKSEHIAVAISLANPLAGTDYRTVEKTARHLFDARELDLIDLCDD